MAKLRMGVNIKSTCFPFSSVVINVWVRLVLFNNALWFFYFLNKGFLAADSNTCSPSLCIEMGAILQGTGGGLICCVAASQDVHIAFPSLK